MLDGDYFILVGMGGFFTLLGLATLICGRAEERGYYDLATRTDMKEFLERPEPSGLKIGGRIAIAIGLFMLALGGGLWLWG